MRARIVAFAGLIVAGIALERSVAAHWRCENMLKMIPRAYGGRKDEHHLVRAGSRMGRLFPWFTRP